jgi:hypothetical protein
MLSYVLGGASPWALGLKVLQNSNVKFFIIQIHCLRLSFNVEKPNHFSFTLKTLLEKFENLDSNTKN